MKDEAGMPGLAKQGKSCLGRLLAVATTTQLDQTECTEPGKTMERQKGHVNSVESGG
jgi:hypothetical protein